MADNPQHRGPGRPKVPEPGSTVSTWVPVSAHDRLVALAKRHEVSVSQMVKSLLLVQLDRRP